MPREPLVADQIKASEVGSDKSFVRRFSVLRRSDFRSNQDAVAERHALIWRQR